MHEHLRNGARQEFLETDIELYAALAASTKNRVLIDLYRSFAQALKEALTQVMVFPGVMKSCVARHERVYEALVEGDAETAQAVTAEFLERVSNIIENLLDDDTRIGDSLHKPVQASVRETADRVPLF